LLIIVYFILLHIIASSATEAVKEMKFGTKVASGMRMIPELLFWRIHAEKGHNTTLDDEK